MCLREGHTYDEDQPPQTNDSILRMSEGVLSEDKAVGSCGGAGMTIHFGTLVLGALALFAAWVLWTLASGLLGITLGEMLLGAVLFALGFAMGRGR